jgi:hypothetical protein
VQIVAAAASESEPKDREDEAFMLYFAQAAHEATWGIGDEW